MHDYLARNLYRAAAILSEAIVEIRREWQPLLQALVLPFAGALLVTRLQIQFSHSQAAQWVLFVAALLFYVLFAVSCHRIILLGRDSLPNALGLYWTMRETRFAGWALLIIIITMIFWFPLNMTQLAIPAGSITSDIFWYIAWFAATWFEGRISLVFPATAIEQRQDIGSSWYLTRGYGLAIAIALFIPMFITSLIDQIIHNLGGDYGPDYAWVLTDLIVFPLIAVGVAVVSVAYRFLASNHPDR